MRRTVTSAAIAVLTCVLVACGGSTDDPSEDGNGEDNNPPVARFSVSPGTQVEVNTQVSVSSGSTDPDGDMLEHTWGIVGPNSEFNQQGSGQMYSFTPPEPGRYEVSLSVTDGTATAQRRKTVVVSPERSENQPPTASVTGPGEVEIGNTVEVIGSGSSDPEGDELTYSWAFAGGSCSAGSLGSETSVATVMFTGDEMGSCDLELTVEDPQGASDTTGLTISVISGTPDNQPPSVVIEGTAGWTGQTIELRAQAADDNDSVSDLTFQWSLGSTPGDESASIQNAQSQQASYTPTVAGDHVVELTVTDTEDASTEKSKTFTVEERPEPVQPNAGDIWINEVMVNPTHLNDDQGEWVELATNASSTNFDLTGCEIKDDTGQGFTIPESAPNFAGNKGYYTVAKSTSVNFTPDYTWTAVPSFNNDGDTVDLDCNNQDLDSVNYDSSYPLEEGKTLQLDRSVVTSGSPASANNDPANWCAVGQQSGSGQYGTPGQKNLACGN